MLNESWDRMPSGPRGTPALLGILVLGGLYAISLHNFLLFHCLTEAFAIVIGIAVFAIFWNTRRFFEDGCFLILGLGALCAGVLDLIYVFGYEGMTVFPGSHGNIAMQAKTVAQWFVSFSCVIGPLCLGCKLKQNRTLLIYVAILLAAMALIFRGDFPDCLVDGARTTAFAKWGLAISCSAYLLALVLLVRRARDFDPHVFKLLAATLVAFFVEDLASALATDLNGRARTVAHLCQVIALYFVYKAFVEVGLTRPYAILLRRQRQIAEDLQRSEEDLRLALEASTIGWWRIDLCTGVLEADDRCKSLFGMPGATVPSFSLFLDRIRPEDRPLAEAHLREAAIEPGDYQGEYGTEWPDGSKHWMFIKGRSFHDAPGKPRCLQGIVMDLTSRKQAEHALQQAHDELEKRVSQRTEVLSAMIDQLNWEVAARRSAQEELRKREELYRGLFNGMSEGFALHEVLFDDAGKPNDYRFLIVNPAFERLTGLKEDEVVGKTVSEVAKDYAVWVEIYGQVALTGTPIHFERFSEAFSRHYEVFAFRPVPGQFACVFMDITERKRAEEIVRQGEKQTQRHMAELAHVARLSTMGEMAATMAHELNQPLHAVNNYARGSIRRLLKTTDPDQQVVDALEQISQEANRAAAIIRRIRAFVQKRPPTMSDVQLNGLIVEVVLLNKADLEQNGVKVSLELAPELPVVLGDPIQIEQVLLNLVRNGLEAMDGTPEADRRLVITSRCRGGGHVEVDIQDFGKGIEEENQEKIFEPFFTTKCEGMGMGLTICRSIIQMSGGQLRVSRNPEGRGSTFHFSLPIVERGSSGE